MTRTSRGLAAGFLMTVGLAGLEHTAAAGPLTVTLSLQDHAEVPREILTRAQEEVVRIYREAGIEAAWQPSGADITIVLLTKSMVERMRLNPDAVGVAPGTETVRGHLAYVFFHRVEDVARGYRQDKAQILGHAIAHEIGHLLLPYRSHTATGLMRADWNLADMNLAARGLFLFTPEQSELMRSRMATPQAGMEVAAN